MESGIMNKLDKLTESEFKVVGVGVLVEII